MKSLNLIVLFLSTMMISCAGDNKSENGNAKEMEIETSVEEVGSGVSKMAGSLNEAVKGTEIDASATGKHCRGTVGCDCKGFKPYTKGKEWEKQLCRDCGHKKSLHQ